MASVTYRASKLIVLFLVVYFRSVKCTLVHDTATDNVDEIFENISEELTETRLRNLLHKTDINKDGNISSDELKTWVASIRQSHAVKLTRERVVEYDSNNDGLVSMKEYFDAIYGTENQATGVLGV
ncbi:calumenin-A-like isoform X2 [Paramuricea clavata]|nr:calumenin-A-like isoform X2 [Paramuricea clavata]